MIWFISIFIIGVMLILVIYNQREVKKAERAFPPIGKFVEVEGLKLHYVSKGTGKPIVFLHGGILSVHDYSSVVELVSENYNAIAFDSPGMAIVNDQKVKIQPQMCKHAYCAEP